MSNRILFKPFRFFNQCNSISLTIERDFIFETNTHNCDGFTVRISDQKINTANAKKRFMSRKFSTMRNFSRCPK